MNIGGNRSVESFHRRLGLTMCGIIAGCPCNEENLKKARQIIRDLRDRFYKDLYVPGTRPSSIPNWRKPTGSPIFWARRADGGGCHFLAPRSCGGHFGRMPDRSG